MFSDGIFVPGLICCGSRIQAVRLLGVFSSAPAAIVVTYFNDLGLPPTTGDFEIVFYLNSQDLRSVLKSGG